jgi:hypothetical protein
MSTYYTHSRVTGFDHPQNGGLGGYCRGNLPRVPSAVGYGPKHLNTVGSLYLQIAGEPYTPY